MVPNQAGLRVDGRFVDRGAQVDSRSRARYFTSSANAMTRAGIGRRKLPGALPFLTPYQLQQLVYSSHDAASEYL